MYVIHTKIVIKIKYNKDRFRLIVHCLVSEAVKKTPAESLANQSLIWRTFYLQAATDCGVFDKNRYTQVDGAS